MASLEELRAVRLGKLALLREAGMDPYPAKSARDFSLADAVAQFDELSGGAVAGEENKSGKIVTLAGRVMALRPQGALTFFHLYDGTAKFQGLYKQERNESAFQLFTDAVDIGDFIEVSGTVFITKRGEKTVTVSGWTMLSKSLLPLPDKWDGLQDVEERYRHRELDILMNPELRDLFIKKTKFWDVTRDFLKNHGFLEVETPTLELTTGGAEARPFKTHHNDYDLDVFMRISVGELWQKRLMAAGFPKTFEIGRAYRNEGSSPDHLQEFTNMEFYWAYADYNDGMALVQDLYRKIAQDVFGTTKFTTRGHSFDLAGEWKKIDYVEEIERQTGVNVNSADAEEMKNALMKLKVRWEGENKERLTDTLWKYCRKNISGPAFVINYPTLVAPLAKSLPGTKVAQKFQPLIAGSELGNGYSELNDPIDQRARFELQQKLIESGDEEAMMADYEFVEMLEHGMPPTCGFGFGERLFAFLADKPVRELQFFPLLRPKK